MRHFNRTSRILVFICLIVGFSSKTPVLANDKVVHPDVCSPQNPDCYFERFSNLKLPRVEPIQASMTFYLQFFVFLKELTITNV